MTKSAQLRATLEQAKSDHDLARKVASRAESDLFFAREALERARHEYVEYLKKNASSAQGESGSTKGEDQ